jgi:hypothetical protein
MIKLKDLLDEAIHVQNPEGEEVNSDDLLKKGFKLGAATIDPKTGASVTDVEYLPNLEQARREILKLRKEFQPYKFSADESIAKVAKEINTNMTKLGQLIFALDKMIELQNKNK